jgi:hypothetical protein
MVRRAAVITLTALCWSSSARAWTISEHARITHDAVTLLARDQPPSDRDDLRDDWEAVVADNSNDLPLCGAPEKAKCDDRPADAVGLPSSATKDGVARCVTFADLPAIAADHSCSPRDLDGILRQARAATLRAAPDDYTVHWIFRVLRDAQVSYTILQSSSGASAADVRHRNNDRDDINLDLAIHDANYVNRAAANTAHFVLPRASGAESFDAWLQRAVAPGEGLNNTSAYVWYHSRALQLATLIAPHRDEPGYGRLLWWAYLDEAFALHFLEDAFAAGHFVGLSKNRTIRNGTHDYFCSHGFRDAHTWGDPTRGYHAFGDAFLSNLDQQHANAAVAASLREVVAVLHGRATVSPEISRIVVASSQSAWTTAAAAEHGLLEPDAADELNVCDRVHNDDPGLVAVAASDEISSVLRLTPQPTIRDDDALSSYRNNNGFIVGIGADVMGGAAIAFEGGRAEPAGQLMVHAGIGFSADGVVSAYRDGTAVMISGLGAVEYGRSGVSFGAGARLRLPWSVVPFFEPLVAVGFIQAGSSWGFQRGAAMSKRLNGSLTPSSNHLAMLTLLREVDVMWYGHPRSLVADPHATRTEIRMPLASLVFRGDRETRDRVSTSVGLDAGARYAFFDRNGTEAHELGFYVMLHPEAVLFPGD